MKIVITTTVCKSVKIILTDYVFFNNIQHAMLLQ